VREQGEEQDEAQRGQQDRPRPGVSQAQRHQGQGAAQGAGQGRVEVPQEGRGLLGGSGGQGESGRTEESSGCAHFVFFNLVILNLLKFDFLIKEILKK